MRKLTAVLVLLASAAWGGDRLLGVILASDGGTVNNANTGYGSAGCVDDLYGAAACPKAFAIAEFQFIDVQCRQDTIVRVNAPHADAGNGMLISAGQIFPSSTGKAISVRAAASMAGGLPDGGSTVTALVSIQPVPGASVSECAINGRNGNE